MNQVVLITGATGALGRPLLDMLRARKTVGRIYALTRRNEPALVSSNIEIIQGDLSNFDNYPNDITAILHLAADTSFSARIDTARATNVKGTQRLLQFAES